MQLSTRTQPHSHKHTQAWVCKRASYRGVTGTEGREEAYGIGGRIRVGGGNGDGNGVGGESGDVNGYGDGTGAGTRTGMEDYDETQDGNDDGSGDGAGTETGTRRKREG